MNTDNIFTCGRDCIHTVPIKCFSTILLKTEQLKATRKYCKAMMVNQANCRYLGDVQVSVIVAVTHSSTKYKSQH